VITGELRSKIEAVWNAFWTGGISNPLEVIEQSMLRTSPRPLGVHAHFTMAPDLIASNNEVVVHYAACQTRLRICAASAALSWGRKRP